MSVPVVDAAVGTAAQQDAGLALGESQGEGRPEDVLSFRGGVAVIQPVSDLAGSGLHVRGTLPLGKAFYEPLMDVVPVVELPESSGK